MTDKEIIINGVDVSECEHYEDLNCFAYRDSCGYPLDCKDNPNCYYKQLKHKEQACEELSEYSVGFAKKCQKLELDVCHLKDKNYNLQRRLDQLKAENIKFTLDTKKLVAQYSAKLKQLKQTFAEIKEIAEEQIPYLNIDKAKTTIEVEYDYANKIYDLEQRMYKILQKIS